MAGTIILKRVIQPESFIYKNNIPFHEGCAIKYLCRWRSKDGVKDLRKAIHFIDKPIERYEEEQYPNP